MFLEKFKTEVYKHPCIYDRTAFKDPIRRKTAWNKVAEAIIGDDKWREMTNKQREMKGMTKTKYHQNVGKDSVIFMKYNFRANSIEPTEML